MEYEECSVCGNLVEIINGQCSRCPNCGAQTCG